MPMPEMPPMPDVPPFAKPAWRTVHVRPKKKKKAEAPRPVASTSAIPVAMHAPPGGFEPLHRGPGSWATWQREYR